MKKKIAVISMTLLVGGLLYFTGITDTKAYYYGPPVAYTGSPFDGLTCDASGCHNSHPLQSAKPWISSNVPIFGYTPGATYTFTARAIQIGFHSFGFEISPQTSGGSPLGTLIVSNATTTQIAHLGSLQYIEQTQNGYVGTDSVVWSFQWKAPVAGTGSVTFYGAFNCGNGNSSSANTFVYPATLIIAENPAGVDNMENEKTAFSLFPNPASEKQINITYTLKQSSNVEINIYGIDGRKISTLFNGMVSGGEHTHNFLLPAGITPGGYLLQLINNNQSTVQRFIAE